MMKKGLLKLKRPVMLAAGLGGWALLLMGLGGATGPAGRVAVVDVAKVTAGSSAIQASIARASVTSRKLTEELHAKQQAYDALAQNFERQKTVLSEEKKKERLAEAEKQRTELDALGKQLQAEVDKAQQVLPPLERKIRAAVGKLATARGCTLVIPTENTVFFTPEIDLTAPVIETLDKEK